ncbi:uncharacterized protein SCHCODRAFT_02614789 [Schizophyllum commune H4-8]|uniref:uncharacterized protein n=1 Tax=Schizophyllum commune (strain H4-8 / FGSC 9210) TaxID=578458 RepID=UPI00215EFF06|nr:uncharacterized protein SCHCODRAFT_02614789 [Schizophyllum commune H4-8]KAI5896418.1 hypothetical protein SCHCODRAFT_02614789 [Schizophyllum commune H4-8]
MAIENAPGDAKNAPPPDTKATVPTIPLNEVKSVSHFADFKPLDKEKANYKAWRVSIEDALTLVGLRPVALGLIPRPDSDAAQAAIWDNNDCLARACIRQRLTEAERDHVEDCTTSKDMLETLRKRHRQEGAITQMALDGAHHH